MLPQRFGTEVPPWHSTVSCASRLRSWRSIAHVEELDGGADENPVGPLAPAGAFA